MTTGPLRCAVRITLRRDIMARIDRNRTRWPGASLAGAALVALVLMGSGTAVRAQGNGGGGGGGGGEEEGFGNNLSVPVVFAEGQGISGLPTTVDTGLRPRPEETNPTLPYFDASTVVIKDGVTYYPQQSASTWQAGWLNGLGAPVQANISWGDNLLSRTWNPKSVIRVETVLYQNADTPLTAYTWSRCSASSGTRCSAPIPRPMTRPTAPSTR
jgi:hypothetical protein